MLKTLLQICTVGLTIAWSSVVQGTTIDVCAPEYVGRACSVIPIGISPVLIGPVGNATIRAAETSPSPTVWRFHVDQPGNYFVRVQGDPCGPYGCYLDTPVYVGEEDKLVFLTLIDAAPGVPRCLFFGHRCPGDTNCDGSVTIEEIVRSVRYAVDGCP